MIVDIKTWPKTRRRSTELGSIPWILRLEINYYCIIKIKLFGQNIQQKGICNMMGKNK